MGTLAHGMVEIFLNPAFRKARANFLLDGESKI